MNRRLDVGVLRFKLSHPILTEEASLARGFFGRLFSDKALTHHHLLSENRLLYRYPLVQYKAFQGELLVIGIEEGVEIVSRFAHLESIQLDSERLQVVEVYFQHYDEEFGLSEQNINYQFLTPWLALNEDNVKAYYYRGSFKRNQELLSRVLVGNILSMAKGLGYTVKDRIHTTVKVKERRCSLKKNPMIGFIGKFTTNFILPDYIGLGKSVSRGFGTVKRGDGRVS